MTDWGEHTDLYRLYDEGGQLLYVGITNNWPRRRSQHRKDKPWWGEVADVALERFTHRSQAERAEVEAIKSEWPEYNDTHSLVAPAQAADDRRSLRIIFRNVNGFTSVAGRTLRLIVDQHPGEVPVEVQAGRGVLPMGRVALSADLFGAIDAFTRGRAVTYGVVIGMSGVSIRRKHVADVMRERGVQ